MLMVRVRRSPIYSHIRIAFIVHRSGSTPEPYDGPVVNVSMNLNEQEMQIDADIYSRERAPFTIASRKENITADSDQNPRVQTRLPPRW